MKDKLRINGKTLFLTRTAILSSVVVVLSIAENFIPTLPVALPGMKLGLSNIAVMAALDICSLPCALCVVIIKALFALVTRGAMAAAMSLAGTLLATLGMWLLIRCSKVRFGCLGVGIAGAFLHNFGQIIVAYALISDAVFAYMVVLSLASLATGALTGLVYYIVMPHLYRVPYMH